MLFNRIPLRVAVAAGAAAIVAGGTFAVSAFADSDTGSDQAASAAVGGKAPQAAASETPFFPKAEKVSKKEREDQEKVSKKKRTEAAGAGSTAASGKVEAKKKEKPKEDDSGSGGSSGGGSVPSGSPKSIAKGMLGDYGWGGDQFNCLEPLWEKESNWNPSAKNPSSGAYGIPQSLPGSKMASAGSDWETNPATQIKWGLGYIEDRYGSPCGAWDHSKSNGWY